MNTKSNKNKGILLLTPFFSPNVGGVETHFDDLIIALDKSHYSVYVQTYSPITTPNVKWASRQKIGQNVYIRRYRWFGKNLFAKIEKFPLFDFLYLAPYLLIRTFFWMLFNHRKVDVIHAQGLNAAFIGKYLKLFFNKRLIVSTHAIYEIRNQSGTAKRIVHILNSADKVLTLSKGSYDELVSFGIDKDKLDVYKHWVDLTKFIPSDKSQKRKELGVENKFTVLFVGRLIEKKGVKVLIEIAAKLNQVNFIMIGSGPLEDFVKSKSNQLINLSYLGMIPNVNISKYYTVSDIFCIPSQYEEGFGRVVIEAVASGLPVVGSNLGGIPEALDETVSVLVQPTFSNLKNSIEKLYKNRETYERLAKNCRKYAEINFSEKNVKLITKYY